MGDDRHFRVHLAAADKFDRAEIGRQRKVWPVDVMGGQRMGKIDGHIRYGILAVEHRLVDERPTALPLQGGDYALTYDATGYDASTSAFLALPSSKNRSRNSAKSM